MISGDPALRGQLTMAHELDFSNDRANIAYLGSARGCLAPLRAGNEARPVNRGMGKASGPWMVRASESSALLRCRMMVCLVTWIRQSDWSRSPSSGRSCAMIPATCWALRRMVISRISRATCWPGLIRYISVDDRFQLDVAGSLKGGAVIWATAKFNGDIDIAGDRMRRAC